MTLLSALLGSVAGLLALAGTAMVKSETALHKIKARLIKGKNFEMIKMQRKNLKTLKNIDDVTVSGIFDAEITFQEYQVGKLY